MTVLSTPSLDRLNDRVRAEIRAELARRGHSQNALARALNVSPMWVSDKLRGRSLITLTDLEQIAAALDMAPSDLIPRGGTRATAGYPRQPIDPLAPRIVATVGEPHTRTRPVPEQRTVRTRPLMTVMG